jgi:DNA-binding beta-propeller fold protein YncE
MKKSILAVCCLAALASGYYLDETILLPDSLGSSHPTQLLAYNALEDVLYAIDYTGSILLVDAGTCERQGRVQAGERAADACFVADVNRLYVADEWRGLLYVIDGASSTLVDSIDVGGAPIALCYDSIRQVLYCSCDQSDSIVIVDVHGDTIVGAIDMPPGPGQLCLNPLTRKLYCCHRGIYQVSIIDTRADTLIDTVGVCYDPEVICCNLTDNKVYCAGFRGYDTRLAIIDGQGDSLLRFVELGQEIYSLVWASSHDKVYCAGHAERKLYVVSGASDSVLARIDEPERPYRLVYCEEESVVCCLCRSSAMHIYDCGSDTVIATGVVLGWPEITELDKARSLIWCSSTHYLAVVSVDYRTGQGVGVVHAGMRAHSPICIPEVRKLYLANGAMPGPVVVIDCVTNSVLGFVDACRYPTGFCYAPDVGKLYCAGDDRPEGAVAVVDLVSDSVLARIPAWERTVDLAYSPIRKRVYCVHAGHDALTVIDAEGDTIVGSVPTPYGLHKLEYVPEYHRLYCTGMSGGRYAVVVDCSTEVVVAAVRIGGGTGGEWICPCPRHGKVYYGGGGVSVVDAIGDTLITVVGGSQQMDLVVYSATSDKVYASGILTYAVTVIDPKADTILTTLDIDTQVWSILWDSVANMVLCRTESTVVVVDCDSDSVVSLMRMGRGRVSMAASVDPRRVYVPGNFSSAVYVLVDSGLGLAATGPGSRKRIPGATVVRGTLVVPGPQVPGSRPQMTLHDASGRRAMALQPGANDVRNQPPGVYFVVRGCRATAAKVVVLE